MNDTIRLALVVAVCAFVAGQLVWECAAIIAGFDSLMITSLVRHSAPLRYLVAFELVVFPLALGAHLIYEASK